ncbi:hypothetical protein KOR34_03900 [Posidoniimonas corsicana]|uniref:Competence protein A n=1 Tax=Posidoniimonas corsicana TaxID=1938618 RepID=A0A5C5VAA5_9BACT|nr:hypothetical protein KOR34_03900 [Posidoniimonas corsicana]
MVGKHVSNPRKTDRRQDPDRRTGGDRRRNSDERHVVIELCDNSLHAAITVRTGAAQEPLLITRTLPWRTAGAAAPTAVDADALAAAFKSLAAEERLQGAEAVVLLGARMCVTRTATGGAGEIDRSVKDLEERGQLYHALGGGDVCVAKSVCAVDARHRHALVSMASQRVVDAVAEAAVQAGLNLRRIESSMVSLSRAHRMFHPDDDQPALLISAHDESLSIGATHNGRLLLEYLPGGSATAEQADQIVSQHLGRFHRACQRAEPGGRQELSTVYLSGSPAACATGAVALKRTPSLTVKPLTAAPERFWRVRDEAPGDEYAAALGASLLWLCPDRVEEGPNLLENWIRESRKHLRPILLRSAAPLAAVLVIAVAMLGLNASLGMRNHSLAGLVALAEPHKVRYRDTRLQLAAADAKLRSLTELAAGLPETPLDAVVNRVGHCLPADVWLDRLTIADQREAAIVGSGFTEGGVFEFVGHIESMPGAQNAALQETGVRRGSHGPVTSFNMTVDFAMGGDAHPKSEARSE